MDHWKVRVFEAHSPLEERRLGKPATHVDNFSVTAGTPDEAKREANAFIIKSVLKGEFVLRSLNHSATEPKTLLAYIQKRTK